MQGDEARESDSIGSLHTAEYAGGQVNLSLMTQSNPISEFYRDHFAHLENDPTVSRRLRLAHSYLSLHLKTPSPRILEVGCGVGSNLTSLRDSLGLKEATLYGIDVSKQAVEAAASKGVQAVCLDLNGTTLPFESETFDVVLFMEVLEHLYNSDLLLREIHRVLRRSGILFLTASNLASWANRLALLLGFQPPSSDVSFIKAFGQPRQVTSVNGHIKTFTRRALFEYLHYFGFRIVQERTTPAGGVTGIIRAIDGVFAYFPSLASHTVVVALKS